MIETSVQERLKQAQARVKTLNSNRETLIGDARVEEQKLKQAYSNLEELGVDSPDKLTIEELKILEIESKTRLESLLLSIEEQLTKGEELMKKYNDLQGEY